MQRCPWGQQTQPMARQQGHNGAAHPPSPLPGSPCSWRCRPPGCQPYKSQAACRPWPRSARRRPSGAGRWAWRGIWRLPFGPGCHPPAARRSCSPGRPRTSRRRRARPVAPSRGTAAALSKRPCKGRCRPVPHPPRTGWGWWRRACTWHSTAGRPGRGRSSRALQAAGRGAQGAAVVLRCWAGRHRHVAVDAHANDLRCPTSTTMHTRTWRARGSGDDGQAAARLERQLGAVEGDG